ncbi:hypothetical protein RUM43_010582 [Polyplax serrata]|uniref:Uncharacterized protein n=1 Tax=Polyplax serrata TaxID=468196 RepID=A0AAN8P0L2_POLSC
MYHSLNQLIGGEMVFLTMKYIHIIVPAVLAVFLSISLKRAAAQPVCSSPYIDNPQNRKLCLTLANFFGLPNSLETYSDDMRPSYGWIFKFTDKIPVGYKGRIPSPDFIENMPGTKRQDVDHVFLRFGRRR